jgi:hypothetical protein
LYRAIGVRPSSRAFSGVVTSSAAAPSEICEAFPAWITPSALNDGLSLARVSGVVPRRSPSSVSNNRPSSSTTGMIWSANTPASMAAAARACEREL